MVDVVRLLSSAAPPLQLCDMDLSSSGGLGMASSVDGKVWVWDTDTGEKRVSEGLRDVRVLPNLHLAWYGRVLFLSPLPFLSCALSLPQLFFLPSPLPPSLLSSLPLPSLQRTLEGHVSEVTTCKFFPSGVVALTGGSDFQLKIWSVETGSCPRTLTGHTRGTYVLLDGCAIGQGLALFLHELALLKCYIGNTTW